jgi:hypothetical protein
MKLQNQTNSSQNFLKTTGKWNLKVRKCYKEEENLNGRAVLL